MLGVRRCGQLDLDLERHDRDGLRLRVQCGVLRCGEGLRDVRGRQQLCQWHVVGLRAGFLQRRCGFGLFGVRRRGQLDLDLERHDRDGLRLRVQCGLQRLQQGLHGLRGRQQLCQRHVYGLRVGFLQRRCGFGLFGVHRRGQLDLDL